MHRSLKLLRVDEEESNLKNRARIFRLFTQLYFGGIAGAAFLFGLAFFLIRIGFMEGALEGMMIWVFLSIFIIVPLIAGILIIRSILRSPLLLWLLNPASCVFMPGSMVKAEYIPHSNGKRSLDKMRVTIVGKEGDSIRFTEDFSPWIWMFSKKGQDSQLKKEDDWYSLKGKRPHLPVDAFILHPLDDSTRSVLVGVAAQGLDPALKLFQERERAGSRSLRRWFLIWMAAFLIVASWKLFLNKS